MKNLLGAVAAAALLLFLWAPWRAAGAPRAPRVVSPPGAGYPLTVELPSGETIVVPSAPRRILPANAAAVDFLTVLVGADRVVALPEPALLYSRLAAGDVDATWLALPVFSGFRAETVLAFEPDLVLAHTWQQPETTAVLAQSGVPVFVSPLPRSWDEVLDSITFLGRLLGEEERARAVIARLDRRRAALAQRSLHEEGLSALCYSNLGAGGSAAGRGTTADVLLDLAGLRNAAAEAGITGHESIDHERLLALDPDVIVVGTIEDSGERPPTETYLLGEPDLARLSAVRNHRIVALSPRLFTTASLALMDAAEALVDEIERLPDAGK